MKKTLPLIYRTLTNRVERERQYQKRSPSLRASIKRLRQKCSEGKGGDLVNEREYISKRKHHLGRENELD